MFEYPVIAALRRPEDLAQAIAAPVRTVFLMYGELCSFESVLARLTQAGKEVFLHIDLLKGLSSDKEAIEFIASRGGLKGIVTTKGHLIKEARKFGLATIHQFFIIDTQAFATAVKSVQASKPDAVELMPGLMPRIVREWKAEVDLPLTVAGLVRQASEVRTMLEAGCEAVAVGESSLWRALP